MAKEIINEETQREYLMKKKRKFTQYRKADTEDKGRLIQR